MTFEHFWDIVIVLCFCVHYHYYYYYYYCLARTAVFKNSFILTVRCVYIFLTIVKSKYEFLPYTALTDWYL
jgi:hypothetical protein